MGQQITLEFMMGLARASEDPEVNEALAEIGDVSRIVRLFGAVDSEDRAHRAIAEFALREARRLRARRSDLSLAHFNERECELLGNHPTGRALLRSMADGDRTAIAPAARLLAEIKETRAQLGFT
jgi:hypothetical protein